MHKTINLSSLLKTKISPLIEREILISTSSFLTNFRYKSILTKEPETIEWINKMNEESVLLDIGSNVGIYSVASIYKGIKGCIAIDPAIQNCAELHNINQSNHITNISIWCGTVTSSNEISEIEPNQSQLDKFKPQLIASQNNVAGFAFNASFKPSPDICHQLAPPINIDKIKNIQNIGITHIKIDVDGAEFEILNSIKSLLKSRELKSILVELRSEYQYAKASAILRDHGFELDKEFEPEKIKNHSRFRRANSNVLDRNYVFTRLEI